MDETLILLHRHELGFLFSAPTSSGHPGHSRMDVMLRPTPTELHFDPSRLYLTVVSGENDISHLTITYMGIQLNKYRFVAGPVRIQDRKGKIVFAFTFGGELRIAVEEQEKTCTLISPAPIFELYQPTIIRFTEEVEILLAERRAEWESNPREFNKHLAIVKPLTLYAACLETLIEKFRHSLQEDTQHLVHFLLTEKRALYKEHTLPVYVPPLSELL